MGNNGAKIVNANVGYNWHDKTKLTFTTNFSERSRFENLYYSWNSSDFVPIGKMTMMTYLQKDTKTHELWNTSVTVSNEMPCFVATFQSIY